MTNDSTAGDSSAGSMGLLVPSSHSTFWKKSSSTWSMRSWIWRREQLRELLVPLHQRRLAAHRPRHRVAIPVIRQRDRRGDDRGEDERQDHRTRAPCRTMGPNLTTLPGSDQRIAATWALPLGLLLQRQLQRLVPAVQLHRTRAGLVAALLEADLHACCRSGCLNTSGGRPAPRRRRRPAHGRLPAPKPAGSARPSPPPAAGSGSSPVDVVVAGEVPPAGSASRCVLPHWLDSGLLTSLARRRPPPSTSEPHGHRDRRCRAAERQLRPPRAPRIRAASPPMRSPAWPPRCVVHGRSVPASPGLGGVLCGIRRRLLHREARPPADAFSAPCTWPTVGSAHRDSWPASSSPARPAPPGFPGCLERGDSARPMLRCMFTSSPNPSDTPTASWLQPASRLADHAQRIDVAAGGRPERVPRHCSGDMYTGVPISVRCASSSCPGRRASFAMPKSRIFARSPPVRRIADDEDVVWLEIAMDDALGVRGAERGAPHPRVRRSISRSGRSARAACPSARPRAAPSR